MKEKYNTFRDLLKNILLHIGLDNRCILRESGFVDDLTQIYSKSDFFIDINDHQCFVFKGDLIYLVEKMIQLVKNSDVSFGNFSHDKHVYILQSLERILVSVKEQEMVRYWTMKLSKEFMQIYEENNVRNRLSLTEQDLKIIELETSSWISQIKGLVSCKKSSNKHCLRDEKRFWYQFNENLKILESFYTTNQFKFMYKVVDDLNMLIAKSTFDSLQNLSRYYKLSKIFNDYYDRLDLERLYQSNNIITFHDALKEISQTILNDIEKQASAIKKSLRDNLNGLIEEALLILKDTNLEEHLMDIRGTINCIYNLYYKLNDDGLISSEDLRYEQATKELLLSLSHYNDLCNEFNNTVQVKCIISLIRNLMKSKNNIDVLEQKSEEYSNYLKQKYRIITVGEPFQEFVKFNELCINFVTLCFKDMWLDKNLNFIENSVDLCYREPNTFNDKINPSRIFIHSSETLDDIRDLNRFLNVLETFGFFLKFNSFLQDTLVERTTVLDHFNRYLVYFSNSIDYNGTNILNEISLYLGFVYNFEVILYRFFLTNESLVLIDSIHQKMKLIEENFLLRLGVQFEEAYNKFKKTNLFEKKLITISDCVEAGIDSLVILDLDDVYKEVNYYLELIEVLENCKKTDIMIEFIQSILNSYFFNLLKQELKNYFEFKTNYVKYSYSFKLFKTILANHSSQIDLFKDEIDNVFKEIKRIYNLKVKYLIIGDNGFEKSVNLLRKKHCEFVLMTTKLNLQKDFKGRFTFSAEDYCLDFGHNNTVFFRTCIETSFKSLITNYFRRILERLEGGELFTLISITDDKIPDLKSGLDVYKEIFPVQKNGLFFEVLETYVDVDEALKSMIEQVIDKVMTLYEDCKTAIQFLYSHIDEENIAERIKIYRRKMSIVKDINSNRFPLFKFVSTLSTEKYERLVDELLQEASLKKIGMINKLLKKTKTFISENNIHNDVFQDALLCGSFIRFYTTIFKKYYKQIKDLNVENNNSDDISIIELEELRLKFKGIYKDIKNQKDALRDLVEEKMTEISNDLIDIENSLSSEAKSFNILNDQFNIIEQNLKTLSYVKKIVDGSSVDYTKLESIKKIYNETQNVEKIRDEWKSYCVRSIREIDISELLDFLKQFDSKACHELTDVKSKEEIIKLIPDLMQEFVTEEYFNLDIKLEDYLLTYDVEQIKGILFEAEMNFKTLNALKRIKEAAKKISYQHDSVILNFEDVETLLFECLGECNAVESYIKSDKYLKDVKSQIELIYKMIRINSCIKETQDISLDLRRLTNSKIFEPKLDKYTEFSKEFSNLFVDDEDSMKEHSVYPLRYLLNEEKKIETLRSSALELQLFVKNTISSYREEVHRFYFVSDEDILSMICGRTGYSVLLLQMYNIDEIITNDNYVLGFKSKTEEVYLIEKIDLSLTEVEFFLGFAKSLNETLNNYLTNKISEKDVNQRISVIDDFINEYYYFNNLDFINSTKLKFLSQTDEAWNGDVKKLYPKPKLRDEKMIIEDVIVNEIYMEYYPPSDIVFTKLTSSIFSLISLGLSKTAGVILFGRSGTGKTETVKYYCRTILRPVYVFCCSEECDITTLENIIIGCIKMGAYLCLDEFNRLNKQTMSSVTELIYKNKDEVKFFLTMNLGYFGRNKLPRSLQSIFTEVRVDNPDINDIVEIFFESHSKKIIKFLEMLKDKCEDHEHYNFGLRAVKTVMNTKFDSMEFKKLFKYENCQDKLMLLAFYIFYYSSLSNKDKNILNGAFEDIFDIKFESNLTYDDIFKFGLAVSTGILVYGKRNSGKSTLIKDLASKNNICVEYYSPPNTNNFFGCYDEVTGDWIDGEFVTSVKQNKDKEVWYVFDCILSSNWIENFNSVLDENKSLCLKSGEIIKIGNKMKFIFEGDDLENVTPATLTRMFTIYIENEENIREPRIVDSEIGEILKKENVLVLTGSGKYEKIINSIKSELKVVDATDELSDSFFGFFKRNDLITRKNKKIYVRDLVLYIERFERSSQRLQEFLREFIQYNKIGDIYPSKLKIILGCDTNNINSRLENKAPTLICEDENIKTKLRKILFKNEEVVQRNLKQMEKCIETLVCLHDKGFVTYENICKLSGIFESILELNLEENIFNILYFLTSIFTKVNISDIFEEIWKMKPELLSYNLEVGFAKSTKQCLKSIISLLLNIRHSTIIVGPKMSGKNLLLNSCTEKFYSDLKIYNFYDKPNQEEFAVYLIDNLEKVPKMLLRKCFVLHLDVPDYICLDYKKFYSHLTTSKDVSEVDKFIAFGAYESRQSNGNFCECCCLYIPEIKKVIYDDTFKDKIQKEYDVVYYNDIYCTKDYKDKALIVFDSVFKYRDFIETSFKLYKESKEKYEKRKTHIEEGYKRINQFKQQASDLLGESVRKKHELDQLQSQIKIKMDKMVEIQILMKVEKERISKNQQELDVVFKKSMEKKKIIDDRMKDIIPLIEESKSKISSISKKHLAEIKTMVKPPEIIKFVIELVYTMLEDSSNENISWPSLIQYVRKEDFISKVMNFQGITNLSNLERVLEGRTKESKKAYNASKACGILYDWIVANYEYKKVQVEVKPLLDETEEIEKEIQNIKGRLEEEEVKYQTLESEINENKNEYSKLKDKLEDLKKETNEIQDKQNLINNTIGMIHNETDNWHLDEPEDPFRKMLETTKWYFTERKNLFISKNQNIEEEIKRLGLEDRSFLKTSTKHKNFYQLLRNVTEYKTDVLIYDVDEFIPQIYKLLKYQLSQKTFLVILVTNFDINFYSSCTYQYEVHEKLLVEGSVDIKVFEQGLMDAIVNYKDLEHIVEAKKLLDIKRKEYQELKSKMDHLNNLNKIYSTLDYQYKRVYGFGLSFTIFKEYLESFDQSNLNESIISEYFSLGLPTNSVPFDIKEEFEGCRSDVTIITDTEDIIYEVEHNIRLEDTISAGSIKSNEMIKRILNEQSTDKTYLIKNVNLLSKDIKRQNERYSRFIFVSEENTNHHLIYDTRILFNPKESSVEKIKEKYLKIFGEDLKSYVEYHCSLMESQEVSFKDLSLLISSKDVCSEEYLKYLVYETKK